MKRKQVFKTYSFTAFQQFLLEHEPDEISNILFTVKGGMQYSCVYLKEISELLKIEKEYNCIECSSFKENKGCNQCLFEKNKPYYIREDYICPKKEEKSYA